jgi:hypothetical protein
MMQDSGLEIVVRNEYSQEFTKAQFVNFTRSTVADVTIGNALFHPLLKDAARDVLVMHLFWGSWVACWSFSMQPTTLSAFKELPVLIVFHSTFSLFSELYLNQELTLVGNASLNVGQSVVDNRKSLTILCLDNQGMH